MQASAPTPNRRTYLTLGVGEVTVAVPEWRYSRSGAQIGQAPVKGAAPSRNVFRLPGGAWCLRTIPAGEMVRESDQSAFLNAGNALLAEGIESIPLFAQSGLAGLEMAGDVALSGAPALVKTVASDAATWAASLVDDVAAVAAPLLENALVPADRIMVSAATYPENTGFVLMFWVPDDPFGLDALATIYFGGPAAVLPQEASGGQFALRLLADGSALLYELDTSGEAPDWKERQTLHWAEPGRAAEKIHVLEIVPHGRNKIAFLSRSSLGTHYFGVLGIGGLLNLSSAGLQLVNQRPLDLYEDTEGETGHFHVRHITGPGVVRLDVTRNQRLPTSLWRLKHRQTGLLNDAAFLLPHPVPAGTPITLRLDGYTPPLTAIEATIRDATTHAELDTDDDGNFLTNEGQSAYYVSLEWDSTPAAGYASALLNNYSLRHPATYQTQPGTPVTGGILEAVSITGPDVTPDHETASARISDPLGVLTAAASRDRTRCLISVDLGGGVVSHLFEGELADPRSTQKGTVGRVAFPSQNWREYPALRMVGLWRRMMDGHVWEMESFVKDDSLPVDPYTNGSLNVPWKVTDVIRYCLGKGGAPADELAIPDLALRLWPSDKLSQDDYAMLPGTESGYFRLAMRLAQEYLGAVLWRDRNSGARGLWRLVFLPQPPYVGLTNFLVDFVQQRPGGSAGKLGTHPGTYGATATWIERNSYQTYTRAPEMNVVVVQGVDKDGKILKATMRNEESITNPAHPDYLPGGVKEYVRPVDPGLPTQQAVNWLCRRIYDVAAHVQQGATWVSPLWLGWDPEDPLQVNPRPNRIGDLAGVAGRPAVIRNCNPDFDQTDKYQKGIYEAFFLDGLVL